jgi:hypothetical protein
MAPFSRSPNRLGRCCTNCPYSRNRIRRHRDWLLSRILTRRGVERGSIMVWFKVTSFGKGYVETHKVTSLWRRCWRNQGEKAAGDAGRHNLCRQLRLRDQGEHWNEEVCGDPKQTMKWMPRPEEFGEDLFEFSTALTKLPNDLVASSSPSKAIFFHVPSSFPSHSRPTSLYHFVDRSETGSRTKRRIA